MNASIPIQNFAVGIHENVPAKRHSRLGLTSLLIAIAFLFLYLAIFMVLVLLQDHIENGAFVAFVTFMAAQIAGVAVHLTGLIIGIAGALKKETKKLLAVLGIVLNAILLVLSSIICILLGAFLMHPFPLGPK